MKKVSIVLNERMLPAELEKLSQKRLIELSSNLLNDIEFQVKPGDEWHTDKMMGINFEDNTIRIHGHWYSPFWLDGSFKIRTKS